MDEDNNFEIFQCLTPVLSPSSSTSSDSDASPALGDDCVKSEEIFQFKMPQQAQTTTDRFKRDKNNEASRRSRLKKKEKFVMMEQRVAELEQWLAKLEKENRELKQKLQLARIFA